jgi:hypothetical protein
MKKVFESDPLLVIGEFLDSRELCQFIQVSSSFNKYAKIVRSKVTTLDIQGFGLFVRDYTKLIALVINSLSSLTIDSNIFSGLKSLQYLSLTNIIVDGYIHNELSSLILFNTVIRGGLELSSISNICIKDRAGRFQFSGLPPSLKVLIYDCKNEDKILDPSICLTDSLEKLHLSCQLDLVSVELLYFSDRIRSLEFSNAGLSEDITIRFPPNLEELNLMNNSYMDVVDVFRQLAKLKYIKSIDLTNNNITDSGFLIEQFPSTLEILIVSKNMMNNIGMLTQIFRKLSLTRIKELTIDYISSFSPPMFEDILGVLPCLNTLSICGTPDREYEITDNILCKWNRFYSII